MWMSTAVYDTKCIVRVFMTETKVSRNNTFLMPGCDVIYTALCLLSLQSEDTNQTHWLTNEAISQFEKH